MIKLYAASAGGTATPGSTGTGTQGPEPPKMLLAALILTIIVIFFSGPHSDKEEMTHWKERKSDLPA